MKRCPPPFDQSVSFSPPASGRCRSAAIAARAAAIASSLVLSQFPIVARMVSISWRTSAVSFSALRRASFASSNSVEIFSRASLFSASCTPISPIRAFNSCVLASAALARSRSVTSSACKSLTCALRPRVRAKVTQTVTASAAATANAEINNSRPIRF